MMRLVWTLLLLIMAGPAAAQTATVRSGEHDRFSRLVIYLDTPAGWRFGRVNGGYALRLDRAAPVFDMSQVYDLIPKTRLASIAQDPSGALQLGVTCECNAEVFEFRPDVLVIDIRDGAPAAGSAFELPMDAPLAQGPRSGTGPVPITAPDPDQRGRLALYWRNTVPAGADGLEATETTLPPALADLQNGSPPDPAQLALSPTDAPKRVAGSTAPLVGSLRLPDPRVTAARSVLLEELSRAATQGLLEIDDITGVAQPGPSVQAGADAAARDDLGPRPPLRNPADHLSVTAETAIDRDAVASGGPAVTSDGLACLSDAQLDVAEWGTAEPAATQIAAARQALIGEFDAPSPDAIGALARLYLYLTFGAEARETLRSFGVSVPDADILNTIAAIMDGIEVSRPGRLADMTDCATAAAMWSTLAQPSLSRGRLVDREAVLRSFSALPLALRRHLGPQLSEKFLNIGDGRTATLIRNAITRAAGPHGAEVTVLDARLNMASGNVANAEAALRGVVADDGTASPEALVVLVENRVARGEPIDPQTAQTAAAMAYEYRGTAAGARLARAQILSQAATGAFAPAFAALAALPEAGPEDLTPRVTEELFQILARTPGDADFLDNIFAQGHLMADETLSRNVQLEIAQRFLRLGFPRQAVELLAGRIDASEAERLALSLAAVQQRDGSGALGLLAGLDGQEASDLRGRAYTLTGDDAAAAVAFAEADNRGEQASAAWRAGELDVVQRVASEPQQMAAASLAALATQPTRPIELLQAQDPGATPLPAVLPAPDTPRLTAPGASAGSTEVVSAPAGPEPGPLARNRALVEQSRSTREALAAVLQAYPVLP